jgi:hypothetical protein
MVRVINPNAAPTWITQEQALALYKRNTGRELNPVERATGWMQVKPKDTFLSTNRYPASLSHQIIAGTAIAALVITLPLWGETAATEGAHTVRVAVQYRIVLKEEEQIVPGLKEFDDQAWEVIEDTGKKALQMTLDYVTE